ncbi:hypothetical protein GCM10027444_38950 [Actinopolyspora lacussalsi]
MYNLVLPGGHAREQCPEQVHFLLRDQSGRFVQTFPYLADCLRQFPGWLLFGKRRIQIDSGVDRRCIQYFCVHLATFGGQEKCCGFGPDRRRNEVLDMAPRHRPDMLDARSAEPVTKDADELVRHEGLGVEELGKGADTGGEEPSPDNPRESE